MDVMNQGLRYMDQLDISFVIFRNRDILNVLVVDPGALGSPLTREALNKIELLRQCEGLLRDSRSDEQGPLALCDDFHTVLDHVRGEHAIDDITIEDAKAIATRYREWLSLPLGGWSSAIYASR